MTAESRDTTLDHRRMERALELAERAAAGGEVPVGAVLDRDGAIIGEGWNQPIGSCDPSAHAELVALRDAARRESNYRLSGTTLYVTIEPCIMCAGALLHARVARLVFAAQEPKGGAIISQQRVLDGPGCNHRVRYEGGLLAELAAARLSDFFAARRRPSR